MSKILASVAALTLMGAATFALPASAAERQAGSTARTETTQSDEVSAQRRHAQRHWRGGRHYGYRNQWGPRRYYGGPRYGYYGGYPAYGYPYGYYQPQPFIGLGVGPFGFRVF